MSPTTPAAELSDADLEGVVGGKGRKSGSSPGGRGGSDGGGGEKKGGDGPKPDPKLDRFFDRQNQN